MSNYYPGQAALIDLGPVEDAANNDTVYNPNVVNVTIQDPTGTERYSWSWPADPDITHVGTGLFRIAVPLDLEGRWTGEWTWDPGTDSPGAEPFTLDVDGIDANPMPPAAPTPTYCTLAQFRAGTTGDSGLSDEAAIEVILQAEDYVDHLLGFRPIDPTTGRKVIVTDVEPWQAAKLTRATLLVAGKLAVQPGVLDGPVARRQRGPDFELEDPRGPITSRTVLNILSQSGLQRLTGMASSRRRPGLGRDFVRDIIGPGADL